MSFRDQKGVSLIELLISLALLLICVTALAKMMIDNSRLNKAQQMTAEVQANARNCLTMLVQRLRSAGWDPMNVGLGAVALDPDTSDLVSQIEVFADLDRDGVTDSLDEQVLIMHKGDRVAWRRTNDTSDPFVVLATNVTNDADGDGTIEPMFLPDSTTAPSLITVRVTAQSPVPDPRSGEFIRYTVSSDVSLRKSL